MNISELLSGLKNKSIKLYKKGHLTNSVIDEIENEISHYNTSIRDYSEKISKGILMDDGILCEELITTCKNNLSGHIKIGRKITQINSHCFNCGETLFLVLINDTTLVLVESKKFYEQSHITNQFSPVYKELRMIPKCSCYALSKEGKLTSEINVPTGELIFKNYFEKDELYEDKNHKYKKPDITSVLGRNKLMQYLATQNVGYGQMSNTSIIIYSNNKDEIIIGNDFDSFNDNYEYFKESPQDFDKKETRIMNLEIKAYSDFETYLKNGSFEELGKISLRVWRWMCADNQVLKDNNEFIAEKDDNYVIAKVDKGTYKIEHYYDFDYISPIYSKIKLID